MAYTPDRLSIADAVHPISVGNYLTILSSPQSQLDDFAIFASFKLYAWIAIVLIFITCIVANSVKAVKMLSKFKSRAEIVSTVIMDHFLHLIGRRKLGLNLTYCVQYFTVQY